MPSNPLLLLAAGQRSGSTLMQRLLTSHPDVLIWGEDGGHLGQILEVSEGLLSWSATYGEDGRGEFAEAAHQSWMATLTPSPAHVTDALRRFVQALYGESAAALGYPVWGFKEVRYGLIEARRLHRFFPDLAVILLVRDPRDVLRSLDEWERLSDGNWTRERTERAIANWQHVAADFPEALPGGPASEGPSVLRLRYEDVVRDPAHACDLISRHTGLDRDGFDLSVFARRVHVMAKFAHVPRDVRAWEDLPDTLRELVSPEIRSIARACGYEIGPP